MYLHVVVLVLVGHHRADFFAQVSFERHRVGADQADRQVLVLHPESSGRLRAYPRGAHDHHTISGGSLRLDGSLILLGSQHMDVLEVSALNFWHAALGACRNEKLVVLNVITSCGDDLVLLGIH